MEVGSFFFTQPFVNSNIHLPNPYSNQTQPNPYSTVESDNTSNLTIGPKLKVWFSVFWFFYSILNGLIQQLNEYGSNPV